MSVPFDASGELVFVPATVSGPNGTFHLRLAVDTGATSTLINEIPLIALGYDPDQSQHKVQVATGSGIETVPTVELDLVQALEQVRIGFRVLCHTIPADTGVDGLLGLNFFRGQALSIDFRNGKISLS